MVNKNKVLFWIENHTIHFGIAKYFKEMYDCDLYGLIACSPKQKDFFDNQKLIKFKKTWYVRDNVKLKKYKPDLKKLQTLEEKFSIPLRKIIYGDRLFYKYNTYNTFSDEEILSIIEQELEFYEQILNETKPDYVIMRAPEFQDIELFYELCKAKKIPLLVLSSLKLGQLYIIASEPYPIFQFKLDNQIKIKSFEELEEHVKLFSKTFHSILKKNQPSFFQKIHALKLLFSTFNSSNINSYRDVGRTPLQTFFKAIKTEFYKKFRRSFLDHNSEIVPLLEQRYAYFPLHVEPDVALLRIGDFYSEQLGIIKNISQSLPIDMTLFVKEHPAMQSLGWRNTEYYKEIKKLPQVKLIHPFASKDLLIKNSDLVITIAGTTSLEAAVFKKPSVVFANINCSSLSCVFKINNLEEIPVVIKECLESKVDLIELNNFFNEIEKSTFSCNVGRLSSIATNSLGVGGFLNINPISELKMKEFLEITKDEFRFLANEHIKKIQKIEMESEST